MCCTHRIVSQPHGNPRPPTVPLRPPLDPQQERRAFFTGRCSPRLMTDASCRTLPIPPAASSRRKEKESTDEIAAPRSRISLDWRESFSARTFGSLRLKVRPPYIGCFFSKFTFQLPVSRGIRVACRRVASRRVASRIARKSLVKRGKGRV